MTPTRILFTIALIALTSCASVRERIIERVNRDSYLATGRAPSNWTPKESLCPAFKRNGWQNHPPEPMCFKPPAKVGVTPPTPAPSVPPRR